MEYTKEQLEEMVCSEYFWERQIAAQRGVGLERLVDDPDPKVRKVVAEQGYGLRRLVHDKSSYVREAVAMQGYGLEELMKDPDWRVRLAVVKQGYRVNKFTFDSDVDVRIAVAEQGCDLDILVNDSNEIVQGVARKRMEELKTLEILNDVRKQLEKDERAVVGLENGRSIQVDLETEYGAEDGPYYIVQLVRNDAEAQHREYEGYQGNFVGVVYWCVTDEKSLDEVDRLVKKALEFNERRPVAEHCRMESLSEKIGAVKGLQAESADEGKSVDEVLDSAYGRADKQNVGSGCLSEMEVGKD